MLSYALEARWGAIWWIENAAEWLAIADELVALVSRSSDPERAFEAHLGRAVSLYELGRVRDAEAAFELAPVAVERLGQPAQQWVVAEHTAMRALAERRFAEAETLADQALRIGSGAVPAEAIVGRRMQLFVLRREQGGWRRSSASSPPPRSCISRAGRCAAFWRTSAPSLAEPSTRGEPWRSWAPAILATCPAITSGCSRSAFCPRSAPAPGDLARAAQLYDLLTAFADRIACDVDDGDGGSVQRALGLLATLLGGRADAAAHREAAIARNRSLGYQPWAAWSRLALSDLLADHDQPHAQALRRQARATAEELGMTELARRATP